MEKMADIQRLFPLNLHILSLEGLASALHWESLNGYNQNLSPRDVAEILPHFRHV